MIRWWLHLPAAGLACAVVSEKRLWCWLPFLPPFEVTQHCWSCPGLITTGWTCVFMLSKRLFVSMYCTASMCTVKHGRTPADGWLVLIYSRGTNLSRQLDSLTDLTADNPAGSVSCNNPGRGVILFGSCQRETQCFYALFSWAKELVIITGSKQGQRAERSK